MTTLDEDLEDAVSGAVGDQGDAGLRRARAWLSRAVEPGTVDLWRFVDDLGPVEAVRRLRDGRAPAAVRSTWNMNIASKTPSTMRCCTMRSWAG